MTNNKNDFDKLQESTNTLSFYSIALGFFIGVLITLIIQYIL